MSEWRECKLGDLTELVTKGTTPSASIGGFANSGINFVKSESISYDGKIDKTTFAFISDETHEKFKRSQLKTNDILFSMAGVFLGKNALVTEDILPANVNQALAIIRLNSEKANPKFINYFLRQTSVIELVNNMSGQSAQPNINFQEIKSIEVNLPNIPEQKAIAGVLSSLDDKIDLLHRQNKTLEQMAEALFRQWFVEEASEDWEEGTLGDVIEIFDGQRIPLSKMERDKKKEGVLYPYYGAAQIMDYINNYIFDGDYILLGEDGTVRTNEGYPVLQYATGKFWVNNHTHVLKAKPPYSNFFLWNYLAKKNIDEIITGAVQPKINQANLKSLDFPKFPEQLVMDFNKISEPLFQKINENKKQIQTLEKLRDNLLPKLMSGEVRVKYS